MIDKYDVKDTWNDYITEYKDLRQKISNLLDTERPLPYEHFKNIFGDTDDDSIRSAYAEWVRQTNSKLHVIVEKHGLCYYPSWTHYNIGLQELVYGDKFEDFVVRMGAWCLGYPFDNCIPDGVGVDELSLDDVVKYCYGDGEVDYVSLYNTIEMARGRLSFRLKDSELKLAIKECEKVLGNAIEDCSKHMESVYKAKFDEAHELYDNSKTHGKLYEIYTLLCEGQFSRWYYSGIYSHGMPINEIVELIDTIKRTKQTN